MLDHWNSFFRTLQKAMNSPTIPLPPANTGIHTIWEMLYLTRGQQLGPATSYEYPSVDWVGGSIRCQDFGSYRVEYYVDGTWFVWGPNGEIAHG